MAQDPIALTPFETASAVSQANLPCPHCGYNVRGLSRPRCPECGLDFDPAEAQRLAEMLVRPRLSLWWLIWNMTLHPMAIWADPQRRQQLGPSARVLALTAMISYFCLVPILAPSIWHYWGGQAATDTPIILLSIIGSGIMVVGITCGHRLLIHARMPQDRPLAAAQLAWTVVNYARLWMIPAAILLLVVMRVMMPVAWPATSVSKGLHNLWHSPLGLGALVGLLACCVLWFLTLYAGGRQPPVGTRRLGLWCAISNPFWYVAALLFVMAALP